MTQDYMQICIAHEIFQVMLNHIHKSLIASPSIIIGATESLVWFPKYTSPSMLGKTIIKIFPLGFWRSGKFRKGCIPEPWQYICFDHKYSRCSEKAYNKEKYITLIIIVQFDWNMETHIHVQFINILITHYR